MAAPRTPLALLPEMQARYEGPLLQVTEDVARATVYIGARAGGALDAAYAARHAYLEPQAALLERLGYVVRRAYATHHVRGKARSYITYLMVREKEAPRAR
jgi:hypothetical protein